MNFSPSLKRYLEKCGVVVEGRYVPQGIVILKNVPVSRSLVNKPRTNLCAATDAARGILVWVDADLRPASLESFATTLLSGRVKENWQQVDHAQVFATHEEAITTTIKLLGGKSLLVRDPAPVPEQTLLTGCVLPAVGRAVDLADIEHNLVGRDHVLDVAERFIRSGARTVVFAGTSGSGLTSCAQETLSRRLEGLPHRVVHIDCALVATDLVFPASTDERFRNLLADCLAAPGPHDWFLLDNVQWPLRAGLLAQSALATALERGLRCVCTCQTDVFSHSRLIPMLARRMHWVGLAPLDPDDLHEILRQRADILADTFGLTIEGEALQAAVRQGAAAPGSDPARTLNVLEAAVTLADKGGIVGPDEVAAAVGASVPL